MSTRHIREALERLQRDNMENRDVTSLVTDAIGEVVAIEKAAKALAQDMDGREWASADDRAFADTTIRTIAKEAT